MLFAKYFLNCYTEMLTVWYNPLIIDIQYRHHLKCYYEVLNIVFIYWFKKKGALDPPQ